MPMYRIQPETPRLYRFSSTEFASKYKEQHLEDWIEANPEVLTGGDPLLIIGRQVTTDAGVTLDLLGLDENGSTVVVELKRGLTPRDIVAQVLEYAAWVASQDSSGITSLANLYLEKKDPSLTLEKVWRRTFGGGSGPGRSDSVGSSGDLVLNSRQRMLVVTEGSDERVASVVQYLRSLGVNITLLEYRYYQTEAGEEILDIEARGEPPPDEHSESRLLIKWDVGLRNAYKAFRDRLLQRDNVTVEPRATQISFYVQTRDDPVYVCSFGPEKSGASSWLRRSSLPNSLDFDASVDAIRSGGGDDIQVEKKPEWTALKFPADPDVASRAADLIVEHIISSIS